MTTPPFPDPHVSDEDAADLVAYLDGNLPPDQRDGIAARIAADPALAAALERRRAASGLITAAVAETHAPHALRLRVDALGTERRAVRRPRRRLFSMLAAAGGVAGSLAVVIALLVSGSGLTVGETVAAALRPPVATIGLDPLRPRVLRDQEDGVRFPNFTAKFGWRPVGARTDRVEGRHTKTVFYEAHNRRIAYTIVSGDALDQPAARRSVVGGVELRTLRAHGRTVVTWRRQGHTCVLSGRRVDAHTLRALASWKGQGAVRF